jgi:hypothetical protein
MQEIRGPGFPDSVPEELVAAYGAQARQTVRYRRSWRYRQGKRVARWMGGRDPWYVTAAGLLWAVILTAGGAAVALAVERWPHQVLEFGVLAAVAAASSALTALVLARRRI